jgi:hypothetical protein
VILARIKILTKKETTSEPGMPTLQGIDSLNGSQGEYQRELIDFSQLTLPTVLDTQDFAECTQEENEENWASSFWEEEAFIC